MLKASLGEIDKQDFINTDGSLFQRPVCKRRKGCLKKIKSTSKDEQVLAAVDS
jgi:hypothetical protein